MKIKISEKLFCEKENSPLLKPQEKVFYDYNNVKTLENAEKFDFDKFSACKTPIC